MRIASNAASTAPTSDASATVPDTIGGGSARRWRISAASARSNLRRRDVENVHGEGSDRDERRIERVHDGARSPPSA